MSSASDTPSDDPPVDPPGADDAGDRTAAPPGDPGTARSHRDPQVVGGYVLEGLLGSGALGRTFRAHREGDDSQVFALKLLHPKIAENATYKRRLIREIEAASKLEDVHVAPTLAHGDDPAGTYVVRALFEGDDLRTAVRRDVITPRRLCELLCQLLSALSEAHRHGVLHRNLKPQNVRIIRDEADRECVKVCDFGNPLRIRPDAEYMAPEQGRGGNIDGQADVYAVGVMLYELLAEEVPFRGATPEETIVLHQQEALLSPRERRPQAMLPRELEAVCMKALAKEPRDRHRSPREMSQALRAVTALLGPRADEPLGSSAFAEGNNVEPETLDRVTMPGEQLRSRTKFWLGAALLVAVCAAVLLNPETSPTLERPERPGVRASGVDSEVGKQSLVNGVARLRGGDAEGAVLELRQARRALGDTPEVLRALGEALVIQGNRSEGTALLARYLEVEPNARDRSFVESLVRSTSRKE